MRAEFEERQKSNPMNSLLGGGGAQSGANPMGNFDMAAFLAGSGSSSSSSGAGAGNKNEGSGSGSSSGGGSSSGNGKKEKGVRR